MRSPSPEELAATCVLSLPITEASAKVRTGPPVDNDADYDLPVWAGVLPLIETAGDPIADPRLPADIIAPENIRSYAR